MGHSNWFSSKVQTDRNEKQTKMDPRAWLVKVAIVRIELLQKDPTLNFRLAERSSRHSYDAFQQLEQFMTLNYMRIWRSNNDRLGPAFQMAVLDAIALEYVTMNATKNDNLGEVLARAARSNREAIEHSGGSYRDVIKCYLFGYLESKIFAIGGCRSRSKQKHVDASGTVSELAIAHTFLAFLASVLHLLTSVFQYLIGYVDRGGSKTYSSGAFDFRASFVALVLFQGAYVWIKFREAAQPDCRKRKAPDVEHEVVDVETCNLKGLHKRSISNSSGAFVRFKYEPRFTPPRQEGDGNTDLRSKHLALGEYHNVAEAQIVRQIARYYYAKAGGSVELKYGPCKFLIPPMSEPERGLAGKVKREWVQRKAKGEGKRMYADFEREKEKHLAIATEVDSRGAEFIDPASSALPLPRSSVPVLPAVATEPAFASAGPSFSMDPLDGAFDGNAADSSESFSGFESMLAEFLLDPGLPNLSEEQLSVASHEMQFQEFDQLPGDLGGVAGGIEHVSERELDASLSFQQGRVLADAGTENIDGGIFLQQSDPMLQQVVFCQKCLGDNARQFVHMDRFKASQMQVSKLEQENESLKSRLQQKIESLKSRLRQVATLSRDLD